MIKPRKHPITAPTTFYGSEAEWVSMSVGSRWRWLEAQLEPGRRSRPAQAHTDPVIYTVVEREWDYSKLGRSPFAVMQGKAMAMQFLTDHALLHGLAVRQVDDEVYAMSRNGHEGTVTITRA